MAKALHSPTMDSAVGHEFNDNFDGLDGELGEHSDSDLDDIDIQTTNPSSPPHSPVKNSSPHRENKPAETEKQEERLQNGSAGPQADRYGFIGGKEFTDPDQ